LIGLLGYPRNGELDPLDIEYKFYQGLTNQTANSTILPAMAFACQFLTEMNKICGSLLKKKTYA
jgi:hypothetical protein